MKNKTKHAITNAAGIAFAVANRGNIDTAFQVLDEISEAAQSLAAVECAPGFAWNEDGRTDWETVCTALAIRIEKGLPCTVGAVRRCIAAA